MNAIDFLQGKPTPDGISLDWILSKATDADLETTHNWVQWAFATDKVSPTNPTAANLSVEDAKKLPTEALEALRQLGERFFAFMMWNAHWRFPNNHNHLRITRVLNALHSAGLSEQSQKIYNLAMNMGRATDRTKEFWTCAYNGRVLPQDTFLRGVFHAEGQ